MFYIVKLVILPILGVFRFIMDWCSEESKDGVQAKCGALLINLLLPHQFLHVALQTLRRHLWIGTHFSCAV